MEKKDGHGTVPYNRWLHQHDEDIMSEFQDRLTADMAGECGVNYYTVSRRAARLGVQKSEEFMHARWKKGGIRKGSKRTKYKMSSDEYMKAHFHDTANAELAEMFGVDVKTVRRWARRLGLQKSEEFMQAVRGKRRKGYYTDEYKAMRNKRIAEVYPDASEERLMQLAEELGIKLDVLRGLAYRIGVRRSSKRVAESMRRGHEKKRKYSPELLAAIAEYHRNHSDMECAEKFGVSEGVIGQLAFRNGWKKDEEYISRLHSEMARRRHRK